jgi:hypothetical protein
MTISEVQRQRRWVLHRGKVPHQPNGKKAMPNNPATWSTYAECEAVLSQFDGLGLALGNGVFGVDIDHCCDAITGKFTPGSRAVVIELDTYGEYSPSGTGCHVLGLGTLPGPGIKKPFGAGAIEIKADGFYFTFTARHLSKTPPELLDRQEQITALYKRFANARKLTVAVPDDEERFKKLWAGDVSDFDGDMSKGDFALCRILARRLNCNVFKIRDEWMKSGLYRDKLERDDYCSMTILKAIGADRPTQPEEQELDDDAPSEYAVEALDEQHEGWFPLGEISVIGGSSGVGKTSLLIPMVEKIRLGQEVFGHSAKPRDYRILLHDRSKRGLRRMAKKLHLSDATLERIIRLSSQQQNDDAPAVLDSIIVNAPGVKVFVIEGLDFWIPKLNDLREAAKVLDGLQRVAIRHNVSVIATVGTPKQKEGQSYKLHRDALIGSSAIGRKTETVVLMEFHDQDNPNSVRRCTVLTRLGACERFYFEFQTQGLVMVDEPQAVPELRAIDRMEERIFQVVKPGEEVRHQPGFGSRNLFFEWKKKAQAEGKVSRVNGKYYRVFAEATVTKSASAVSNISGGKITG